MGIKPTRSNFKAFSFDGTSSRNYGVYITGQGVFNAPERNVEMVDIPGRDGAYALDKGNFNNIEVTYPASIVADTEADFADAVSDLRNFLCSKVGYCRLEDEYNPNEYRMAIYKSGLDVSHEGLRTGEFDIVFECKPQRWLTSGETKIDCGNIATPYPLNNPTLFPSKPLLEVIGYGEFAFTVSGNIVSRINIENRVLGDVILRNGTGWENTPINSYIKIHDTLGTVVNTGDSITCESVRFVSTISRNSGQADMSSVSVSVASVTPNGTNVSANIMHSEDYYFQFECIISNLTFVCGTNKTYQATVNISVTDTNGTTHTATQTFEFDYYGTGTYAGNVKIPSFANVNTTYMKSQQSARVYYSNLRTISADSTVSALGNPMYIDCDTGECYKTENGVAISTNNAVTLPAELPTLQSGNVNAIVGLDNYQITSLKVVPRWWKV